MGSKSWSIDKRPLLIRKSSNSSEYGSVMEDDPIHQTALNVQRPVYQIEDLNEASLYEKPLTSFKSNCSKKIRSVRPLTCLMKTVPILEWLPQYNWRRDILGDILSGMTVAVMHIPHGMAYGMLGNLPAVYGMYMGFFPVLIYILFGTSRHISVGTFAVVCLMTGKVVSEHSTHEILSNGTIVPIYPHLDNGTRITNVEVATAVTFCVSFFQLAMYLLRLGIVTTLLSETLVNGFTCGAAFHVVSSQLKDIFGLPIVKSRGMFSFVYTVRDAILALPQANPAAVIISAIFMFFMSMNNEVFKPWLAKRTKIPVPIELLAIISGTVIAYCFNLHEIFGISVVGKVPTGLPVPTLPNLSLIPSVVLDSFVITIISYTIAISMALLLARDRNYEVNSNQELLALGLSNLMGSLFSCMPVTASLSRSLIQKKVGGATQLAGLISCFVLLAVLLWIAPIFELLPRCVLASIIVVALKGMIMLCKELRRYWALSKWDAVVWIVTFFTTVFVAIDIGLAAGVIISLLSIFLQSSSPNTCLLGVVPNTDLYLDVKRYKGAQEIAGMKIFHYSGALNFASKLSFKNNLFKLLGFEPAAVAAKHLKDNYSTYEDEALMLRCLILDFSALTYIDPAGVDQLRILAGDYQKLDIKLYITGCSGPVYEMLVKCDRYERKDSKFIIFPTVHDAVLYGQVNILKTKES